MRPTMTRKRELLLSEGEKDLHEDTIFKLKYLQFQYEKHKIEKSSTLNKHGISAPYHNYFPYGQLKVLKMSEPITTIHNFKKETYILYRHKL